MKRARPLSRRTPLRAVNRKRRQRQHARNFGARADAVRELGCLVWPCCRPVQAAHTRARGMGGAKGDRFDLVPLCWKHHAEAGEARTGQRSAFEQAHGLSLDAEAARIAAELTERGYE